MPRCSLLFMVRIGVISDTHGWLRPEAIKIAASCDVVLHAGDVGDEDILTDLERIAPTYTVRGNTDNGAWGAALPETRDLEFEGQRIHVIHDLELLGFDPAARGLAAVISGHTHRPELRRQRGVLHLNPGSAGPRRSGSPVTMGILVVEGPSLTATIVPLVPS